MTPEDIKRLKALLAKSDSLDENEKNELGTLQAKAKEAGLKPKNDDSLTDTEVEAIVSGAVSKALEGSGLDEKTLKGVQKSLEDLAAKSGGLTEEGVKAILKDAVPEALTGDQIAEIVKKAFGEKEGTSLSRAEFKAWLEAHENKIDAQIRASHKSSRHEFPEGDGSDAFPIVTRQGNLSVAQKQLLNICMSAVGPEAIRKTQDYIPGYKRPTDMNDGITEAQLSAAQRSGEARVKSVRESVKRYGAKAITAGGSATGAEFVPSDLSSELMSRLYLNSDLAAELLMNEIQMPTDPFKLPLSTTRPTFLVGSEAPGSDPTDSTPATAAITLTTGKLIGVVDYSYEADEDSIIAILPWLTDSLGAGAAESFEGAVINGDTTATHQDSDFHAVANHHAKLFKGLRKYALAGSLTSSWATGGVSAANFAALRKLLGKYGVRPSDLCAVSGVNGYHDLIALDETLTSEKVGSDQARILTGMAPTLYGVKVITSEQMRENLNASGVYDDSVTTKGSFILMHKPSWVVGVRRGFTVEVDPDPRRQLNGVIASFRRAFMPVETPSTTVPIVGLAYNWDA